MKQERDFDGRFTACRGWMKAQKALSGLMKICAVATARIL